MQLDRSVKSTSKTATGTLHVHMYICKSRAVVSDTLSSLGSEGKSSLNLEPLLRTYVHILLELANSNEPTPV